MRVLVTTALLGCALMAGPALAQSTINNGPGDTYRGKPGPSPLEQSTVGLKSAAIAQPPEVAAPSPSDGHNASASQTLNPTMANGAPPVPVQAQTGERTPTSTVETSIPKGWTGSPQAWTEHTAACAKRYKSYDAATDLFVPSRGKTAKCTIAMPK